jgi:hypothetical protein
VRGPVQTHDFRNNQNVTKWETVSSVPFDEADRQGVSSITKLPSPQNSSHKSREVRFLWANNRAKGFLRL